MPETFERRADELERRLRNLNRRAVRASQRKAEGRPYPQERIQALLAEGDALLEEVAALREARD